MSKESPLGSSEERVAFDVGSTGARADTAVLFFDEELADEGLAETVGTVLVMS